MANIPVDHNRVFTPIEAESSVTYGPTTYVRRDRATAIGIDGQRTSWLATRPSRRTPALFLNQSAVNKLTPTIAAGVNVDFVSLFPVGQCVYNDGFIMACINSINMDGYRIEGIDIGYGNATMNVKTGHITTYIDAWINMIFPVYCGIRVDFDYATFAGTFALQRRTSGNLEEIDVVQTGMTFAPGPSRTQFVSGICSFPIIDSIAASLAPDIGAIFRDVGMQVLRDPDGGGPADSPVAGATERALAGIRISSAIGTTLRNQLYTPLNDVVENDSHVALFTNTRLTSGGVAPDSPDLPGSYAYLPARRATYPGARTPSGASYDLALALSVTGFNQLLKAQTEAGLLTLDITKDANGAPLTLASLFEAGGLGPCPLFCLDPLEIRVRPAFAPVVVPEAGPDGELVAMEIGGLRIETWISGTKLLDVVFDARVGMGVSVANNKFGVALSVPHADAINFTIVDNPNNLPDPLVQFLVSQLTPSLFPLISGAIQQFQIPTFGPVRATITEAGRIGDFLYLFGRV
ncbi:MAG: hypothetical protein R2695_15325 [Acidimicrobiales bacterium]